MSQEIEKVEPQSQALSAGQVNLIKRTIAPDLNDAEFALFIEVCRATGLSPIKKQIYGQKRGGRLVIITAIDGYRAIAQRSGEYRGQMGPFWCGEDGVWKDHWIESKPPVAAKVGVLREGYKEPVWGFARFASYAADNLWKKMPEQMIAKVAEALALRKAFPDDLAGLYSKEEMDQAGGAPPTLAPVPQLTAEEREGLMLGIADSQSVEELKQVAALIKSHARRGALSEEDRVSLEEKYELKHAELTK